MLHHLIFFTGVLLACQEILAIPRCSVERSIAFYDMCNLTRVPSVPEDVVTLSLNFNSITEVNVNSFPLLERLQNLFLGTQSISPVTIGKEAFRNLPYLQLLDLGDNKEIHLDSDAFVGLSNLHTLRLYHNKFTESILEGDYFQDLVSLEYLDLAFNVITRLHPHPLFYNLTSLKILDFKLNHIETICEGDLDSFQGKDFKLLKLDSISLYRNPVDWSSCGNPFKNISIETLDISGNGWDTAITQQFFKAIQGVPVQFLKLSHHTMGASYGFSNLKDPDSDTFASLALRGLRLLDISHGFIFSLKSYVFQYFYALELLDLNNNNINQIEKAAFFGLRSLKHLNLSYNLLGELPGYIFKGLDNVASIDLKNNHIGLIHQAPFKDLLKLQTLDLQENALKTIDSLPPNLVQALLGDNRLKSTINAINVIFLDLRENRLENLDYLYKILQFPDLQYAVLRNNRLSSCYNSNNSVPENNQLIYLDLGNNMLRLVWESKLCLNVFKTLYKLQVLHLNNNYLSFLPEDIFSGLVSLVRLNLSSNMLSYISQGTFPKTLRRLDLSSNQLLYPNPELFATLDYLDLTFNRYYCDCPLSDLIVWLNQTNVSIAGSQNEMFCFGPPVLAGVSLYALSVDECNEDKMLEMLQFALFIFTCVTVTVFLMVVVAFIRFRGTCFMWYKIVKRAVLKYPQSQLDGSIHRYDVYLCYCSTDFEWVQKSLIQHLDTQYSDKNQFTLCFEHRDFLPGEDHIDNIRDAIWNSKKTICVVTKQFLKDGWCVEAFNLAQSRYFCDLKDVLIMVVAGSLSQYQLLKYQPVRVYMQRGHYLRWPADDQDVEWFLNTLSHKILKEKIAKKSRMQELRTITGS